MAPQRRTPGQRRRRETTGSSNPVGVRFKADQLAALDSWIANQPKPISRPQAIRAFVEAGLHLMGDNGR
jgi:hypothetical protein